MAEEITNNLVYLTENLTNLTMVLTYCVQNKIITRYDRDKIMAGETPFDKNDRFFDTLVRNWEGIKINIIEIFRKTSNEHCADKIEGVETLHKKSEISILNSKWWPEEKKLPLAFLERKYADKKLVDVLKENLTESKNKSTVINQGAAVSGMGGVGKTTVAKWFAIHFRESYDHIIWIDSGEDNLSSSFTDLARRLRIDTAMKLKTLARECFSKLEKVKCLFIFDNAECYQGDQGIRDVLPKHENFHTIITSRTKEWGSESGDGKIPEMHLTTFSTKHSVEFLTINLKDTFYTEGQLEELSEVLGNLPLALQIAFTTINSRKLSIDEYIQRTKKTDHIINVHADDYEKSINKTMKISLDIIKNLEEDSKQMSHNILLILGYIEPNLVEFKLFQAIENLSEFETIEAMKILEKFSLITIDSSLGNRMETCSINRLLQQVIRHNDKENAQNTLKKILSVEGFLNYKLLPYLYADEETQNLFPKIRAQLVDQSKLEELIEQRKFAEAVELSRTIKDILKTPMAENTYASCLDKMKKWVTAETSTVEGKGPNLGADEEYAKTKRTFIFEKNSIPTKNLLKMKNSDEIKLVDVQFTGDDDNPLLAYNLGNLLYSCQQLKQLHLDSSSGTKFRIPWNILPACLEALTITSTTIKIICNSMDNIPTVKIPNIKAVELNMLGFVDEDNKCLETVCINTLLVSCEKLERAKLTGFNMVFDFNQIRTIKNLELYGTQVIAPTKDLEPIDSLIMSRIEVIEGGNVNENVQTANFFKMQINTLEIKTGYSPNFIVNLEFISKMCKFAFIKETNVSFDKSSSNLEDKAILEALKFEHSNLDTDSQEFSKFISNCDLNFLSYHNRKSQVKIDVQNLPKTLKVLELKGPYSLCSDSALEANPPFNLDKLLLEETPFTNYGYPEIKYLLKDCKAVVIKQVKNFKEMECKQTVENCLQNLCTINNLQKIVLGRFPWENIDFNKWTFLSQYGIQKASDFYSIEKMGKRWHGKEISVTDFHDISTHQVTFNSSCNKKKFNANSNPGTGTGILGRRKLSSSLALTPNEDQKKGMDTLENEGLDKNITEDIQQASTSEGGTSVLKSTSSSKRSGKEVIEANFDYLAEYLTNILKVCNKLIEVKMLSSNEKEKIVNKVTTYEKGDELFSILTKRVDNINDFKTLILILEETGNENLSERLKS